MADVSGLGGANNFVNLLRQVDHDEKKLVHDGKKPREDESKSPYDAKKLLHDEKELLGDAKRLIGDGTKLGRLLGLQNGNYVVPPPGPGQNKGTDGGGSDMTPPGPDTSASMAVTLAEIRSVSGKASELLNKVLVTQLQQEGNELLQQQLAARQASKDSLLSAAGDLRNQGADILKGAVQSFAISVAVSSVSMGMTVAGGLSSLKGLGQEAKETGASVARMKSVEGKLDDIQEKLAPSSKAVPTMQKSIGKIETEADGELGALKGSKALSQGEEDAGEEISKDVSKAVSEGDAGLSEQQQLTKHLSQIRNAATESMQAVKSSKSKYTQLGTSLSETASNLSKLGESASNFASSMGQYDQKMDEAQEKTDEANATQADSLVDAAKDARQKLSDMVDKVIEFIKDIQDAKADMMASVVHKGA